MKLGDLEFKVEDFENVIQGEERKLICAALGENSLGYRAYLLVAERANALLAERLEKATQIWKHEVDCSGHDFNSYVGEFWDEEAPLGGQLDAHPPTHTARIVCIEEIPK